MPAGTGNIVVDPLFADAEDGDFRLLAGSPCLDAGDNAAVSGATDLAGNPRVQNGTVDMGAYEGAVTPALPVPESVDASDGLYPDKVRVSWEAVIGASCYRVYRALYLDGLKDAVCGWQTNLVFDDTLALPDKTYWYWVKAAADTRGLDPSPLCVPDSGTRAFAPKWHVNAARPNDNGDGLSWAAAKKTIQAAVDAAAAGDAILVANGVYNEGSAVTPGGSLSNRVIVAKAVTIRSVNGAAATIIEGSGTNFYGTAFRKTSRRSIARWTSQVTGASNERESSSSFDSVPFSLSTASVKDKSRPSAGML